MNTDKTKIINDMKKFMSENLSSIKGEPDLENLKRLMSMMLERLETVHKVSNEKTKFMREYLNKRLSPEQMKSINVPDTMINKKIINKKKK